MFYVAIDDTMFQMPIAIDDSMFQLPIGTDDIMFQLPIVATVMLQTVAIC